MDLRQRISSVEMLLLDVDGVLTDGSINYSDNQTEQKRFHVHDGAGLKLWGLAGRRSAIITGRRSSVVDIRAAEMGVELVIQGATDKLVALRQVLDQTGLRPTQLAAIGDDLPDLPVLRSVAVGIAVADAVAEVRQDAAFVTTKSGGRGAVREAIEWLLRSQGKWEPLLAHYRQTL